MITHALFAACFAFYMVNPVRWQYWHPLLNRKPFSCTACLSAWMGLLTGIAAGYGLKSIEVMFLAGVMGIIIENGIKRYL